MLASAIGVGTAGSQASAPVFVTQSAQALALTGTSHTMLLVTLAALMVFAGLLLTGLSRRHGNTAGGMAGIGPPLRL